MFNHSSYQMSSLRDMSDLSDEESESHEGEETTNISEYSSSDQDSSNRDFRYARDEPIIDLVRQAINRGYKTGVVARTILLAIQNYTNMTISPNSQLRDISFILELQHLSQSDEPIEELIKILPVDYSNTILEDRLLVGLEWMSNSINQISSIINVNNPKRVEYKGYMINVAGIGSVPRDLIIKDKICNDQERNGCGVIILYLLDYYLITSGSSKHMTEVPDGDIVLQDIDPRGNRYQLIPSVVVYYMIRGLMGEYNNQSIGLFNYDLADQVIKRSYIRLILNYNQNTNYTELNIKLDPRDMNIV